MKKRFFTLLEVIIGLFLAAILLTYIFSFFSEITHIEKNMRIASEKVLSKNSLKIKLDTIFSKIVDKNAPKEPSFYTLKNGNELYFVYDNGIDPSPSFSSMVFARLYLEKNNLILETHPIDFFTKKKNKPRIYREEILAKNITSLSFIFLEKTVPKTIQENSFASSTSWEKDHLPSSLKITLTIEKSPCSFIFFLPGFSITYRQ